MPGVVDNREFMSSLDRNHRNLSTFDSRSGPSPDMKGGSRNRVVNGYNSDQNSDAADESPRYLLEHLATFSVGSEFGLLSTKDGLRRLLQMEKTSGIWTQKMQMKLDKNWIWILDNENGDVVEKFPMNLIRDPTAYTSHDPREIYNNVLIFIVQDHSKDKSPSPSEMHIFQCSRVLAQDVVDEIKMFISGKTIIKPASDNIRHLPPPPHNPPPEPPVNGKVRDHVALFSASSSSAPHPPPPRNASAMQQRLERSSSYTRESNDETSSTTSDKYEREVTILNHCFDDIERFVVRLQHAAAAYKELERRQKSRKNKKKDMGDGMLSMRAKPPPEREFVDVLQKFKLSFNLLAKLKSHIHDPNAPELVHFLFTPLALIVDAARDSIHSSNIAASVVSPLLLRDAIELLANCCTSKETDLWHSLGDAWIVPRDQWKGYESSYRPVFSNGWSPENPCDENNASHNRPPRTEMKNEMRNPDYQRVFERDSRYGSDYFGSDRGDDTLRNESPAEHPRAPFDRPYEHVPPDARREFVDRHNGMSPESDFPDRDIRSEFSSDSIEHSELNPERQFDRMQLQWLDDLKNRRAKIVQVVYPRTANNDKELTVIRGEILEVLDDSRKWWKARSMRGQVAHVPHTIVTPYPAVDDDIFNNPTYGSRTSRDTFYSTESPSKEQYIEEGTTRSQESARSSTNRPSPADWVRRERQGNIEKLGQILENKEDALPSPPASPTHMQTSSSSPGWLPPPPEFETNSPERTFEVQDTSPSKSDITQSIYLPKPRLITRQQRVEESTSFNTEDENELNMVDAAAFGLLQEELKNSITQRKGQKYWRKITCPEHDKTECFYITQRSSQADVQHWLKLKGFNEKAREVLRPMSAEMLFNLKKFQLENYLGDEGVKLHSFLQVQKNMSGYKTYTSKELNQILTLRRRKAEETSSTVF